MKIIKSRASLKCDRSGETNLQLAESETEFLIVQNRGRKLARAAASGLIITFLCGTGCVVGPNFKRPPAPTVNGYTPQTLTNTLAVTNAPAGKAQRFVEGMEIPSQWWAVFHSRPLNDLIERSLTNNPDLKAAQAALVAARENVFAQRGAYYPNVGGSFSGSHQKQSELLAPTPNANVFEYSLFTPQLTVSYMPDVFGLNRRTVESTRAQEAGVRYQMVATYLTLTANVVVAAIQEASLRAQIKTTRRLIDVSSNMIDVVQYQYAKGYAGGVELAAQESQLAQMNATLPPLLKQLAQQEDLLADLAGDFPSQQKGGMFDLAELTLPEQLPVTLPSKLVEHRPDVLQAESNVHAASAQIGIAVANRLPNITLTADAGSTALSLNKLFSSGSGFWEVGGALAQPIYDGGALLHRERAAKAEYAQAVQQYRSTVLSACQNVADTLNALEQDAAALKTAADAADAAKRTLDLAQQQLRIGYANYLNSLIAEQTYQQAEINLVQAEANRFSDTAALFQALGGGWWNVAELKTK